ncbi:MAG: hypothetical protein JWM38_1364 [Sphingomonas bacterium]|jgi:hypothetical protein|nr:hypothetical protein [Sphingomonas bacterium]MDB5684856.1 hypothetical protein [Sphingomonas bacterium]MDB5717937.1 hypothetical protein [Sphingomonas bacterium]
MLPTPALADLAHIIQLAVAPVFLLTGVSGFLNVLANRLGRVVDRARKLEAEFTDVDHPHHQRQVAELRGLDRRIMLANWAILLCTSSAVLICLVVAGLFVASLADLGFARTMAVGFVLAMLLLISGLGFFVAEVRISLGSIRIRDELLEREPRRWGRR